MKQTSPWIFGVLCGAVIICTPCSAQEKMYPQATADEVNQILESKNQSALTAAFDRSQKLYIDRVAQAYRRYRLNHSFESGLYAVLPASARQMNEMYQLTEMSPPSGDKEFEDFYEGYYKTVFKDAPKHPKSYPTLFAIGSFYGATDCCGVDGESPWFCELLHDLYVSDPDLYLQALADPRNRHYRQGPLACAADIDDMP